MRKLNKNAKIVSKDQSGNSIEVTLKLQSVDNLGKDEIVRMVKHAARSIADGLRTLPYSDFGPENTDIEI